MKIKSQKGSITIFVLIAVLFYTAFLLLMYAANTNKFKTISEKSDILKGIYEKNTSDESINNLYNKKNTEQLIAGIEKISLPAEYQQVAYLESTGTQYIDTELYLTLDTEIECRFMFTDIDSGYPTPYGCKPPVLGLYPANNNYVYTGFGSNIDITFSENLAEGPKIYIHNKDGLWVNGAKKITYNNTTVTEDSNVHIFVFSRMENQQANRFSKIRLYKLIIRRDGTKYREYIPVYNKRNSKPGLYDLVENKFYTNQGTGEFVVGPYVD